jgi:ATP-dependent protease HslVU (ClpYQ) peptidase subunit
MVSSLVLVACGWSSLLSSPAIVSTNTKKQNRQQNRGVMAHKVLTTMLLSKFLSVLTKHTGATCNQPVEPAKDWRSD